METTYWAGGHLVYSSSLAFCDTGFNLFYFASRIFGVFYFFNNQLAEYWNARSLVFIGVYLGFLNTSNSLVLVLSLERCICVRFPLKAKRMLSARHMTLLVIAIYTLCLCGTGLTCFMYKVGQFTDPATTNVTRYVIALTDFYINNRPVFDAIAEITFNATVPIATIVMVTTSTVIIAVRMRSVMAWRKNAAHGVVTKGTDSSSANQSEAAVTRMVQIVAVVYTVCTTPNVVSVIARSFVPDYFGGRRYNNLFFATLAIAYMLEAVNCSVNFIIYYTMSTKYRVTFQGLFCRRGKGERRSNEGERVSGARVSVISSGSGRFDHQQWCGSKTDVLPL